MISQLLPDRCLAAQRPPGSRSGGSEVSDSYAQSSSPGECRYIRVEQRCEHPDKQIGSRRDGEKGHGGGRKPEVQHQAHPQPLSTATRHMMRLPRDAARRSGQALLEGDGRDPGRRKEDPFQHSRMGQCIFPRTRRGMTVANYTRCKEDCHGQQDEDGLRSCGDGTAVKQPELQARRGMLIASSRVSSPRSSSSGEGGQPGT